MAAPSVLIIEELNGQKRKVELRGPAMPFQGAGWGTRQSIITTWYQGNSIEATQHVLGPQELASDWEGEWNTTRMVAAPSLFFPEGSGSGDIITRASTIRDVLDDIFLFSALLRVTWAADDTRKIVRLGRAEEWQFDHTRADDIRWKITWAWKGRGGRQQRVVAFRQESDEAFFAALSNTVSQLVANIEGAKIVASKKGVKNSAQSFTLGDLEAIANGPKELLKSITQSMNAVTNTLGKVANLAATVASTPAALASQIIDVVENTAAILNSASDALGQGVPESYVAVGSDFNRASPLFKATTYVSTTHDTLEVAQREAATLTERVRRSESALKRLGRFKDQGQVADILSVHLAKKGESFVNLSSKYYNTPDHGADIAKANGYPTYQPSPPPGAVIVIPNLKAIENLQKI